MKRSSCRLWTLKHGVKRRALVWFGRLESYMLLCRDPVKTVCQASLWAVNHPFLRQIRLHRVDADYPYREYHAHLLSWPEPCDRKQESDHLFKQPRPALLINVISTESVMSLSWLTTAGQGLVSFSLWEGQFEPASQHTFTLPRCHGNVDFFFTLRHLRIGGTITLDDVLMNDVLLGCITLAVLSVAWTDDVTVSVTLEGIHLQAESGK